MTDESTPVPAATASDGIPPILDTPQTQQLVADTKADVGAIVQAAAADVKAQVDTGISAVGKLLQIAAGDESVLLNDAEAAAIPIIAHNVPVAWQPEVLAFGALASAKLAGPLNTVVSSEVQKGLVWSAGWLSVLQKELDAHF